MQSTPSWRDDLAPGDILSIVYPSSEGDPRFERPRPCLVLAVDRSGPEPELLVAYGTSAMTRANTGYEIRVTQEGSMRDAGLHRPTRFVAARRMRLGLSSPRIVVCVQGTARIGRLSGDLRPRLEHVLSLLPSEIPPRSAERDRRARHLRRGHRPRAATGG